MQFEKLVLVKCNGSSILSYLKFIISSFYCRESSFGVTFFCHLMFSQNYALSMILILITLKAKKEISK